MGQIAIAGGLLACLLWAVLELAYASHQRRDVEPILPPFGDGEEGE